MAEQMMEENLHVIHDLYSFIGPRIPCDQSRITRIKYSRVKHADKYGSTLLRLLVELVNTTTGEEWTLKALAKTLPRQRITSDLSEVQVIFKNEVGIYTVARNAINTFLKQNGIETGEDFILSSFGGRINLNGSNDVDHNAALILMDFGAYGYNKVHSRTGFDLDCTKAILVTLAKLHGSTLGLKIRNLKEFKDKVRPYLGKVYFAMDMEEVARSHLITVLKEEGFSPGVVERALATFNRKFTREVREPWATFTHTKIWVENILVKLARNKSPLDIKLKGFQECQYSSPLRDLLFFLFGSVQQVILTQHLDELIDFYYYNLLEILRHLDVDTNPFSRLSFNQELRAAASQGCFRKIVCMLYTILNTKMDIQCLNSVHSYIPNLKDPLHINRLCYIVTEFDKRGWICA